MIEVRGVTAGYDDIIVVRDLTFTANPGEVLAVLGRNGAGKTTTLKAMSGLIPVSAGEITLDGKSLAGQQPYHRAKKGLSFVQDGKRIFKSRTVEENLVLGAYTTSLKGAALARRVDEGFERFPMLHEKRGSAAGSLSGGQQQMLAIAQALMRSPKVLMLDEPSAGLAPAIVADVFSVIASLRDEGMAIVLVEQAVGWANSIADRVVVMELGRVIYEGSFDGAEAEAAIERIGLQGVR